MKRYLFSTNLTLTTDSFERLKSQFIYVEDAYNEAVNNFLLKNYEAILSTLRTKCKQAEFVFIPQLFKDISTMGDGLEGLLAHYFPYSNRPAKDSPRLDYFTTPFFTHTLFSNSDFDEEVAPGLIRFLENVDSGSRFEYIQFELSDSKSFTEQIAGYLSTIPLKKSGVSEETGDKDSIETAQKQLAHSEGSGIWEEIFYLIGSLVNNEPRKLSRLKIDSENNDYAISLPDYDDLAVEMTPLHKSLYILFLRHPEGIILSHISDYEIELREIYKHISNREDYDKMKQSIHRICTREDGSRNQIISRIREAFTKKSLLADYVRKKYIHAYKSYEKVTPDIIVAFSRKITEEFAKPYVVSRGRGDTKQIPLLKEDKSLIEIPESFDCIPLTIPIERKRK
jgi:hypothetical protein